MRRRAITFLSVFTLLLCGGLLVLGATSYQSERVFTWGDASRLTSDRGRILLQAPRRSDPEPDKIPAAAENAATTLGFAWRSRVDIPPNSDLPYGFHSDDITVFTFSGGEDYETRHRPLFVWSATTEGYSGRVLGVLGWQVVAPIWFLILLLAPLPARWLMITRRQSKRLCEGCCLACGYDLRASSDRCPECGVAVPALAKPRAAL